MRAYLRDAQGYLTIVSLDRVPGKRGVLSDGDGEINLADQRGRTELFGWPDEGRAGIYAADRGGREYVIPLPLARQ